TPEREEGDVGVVVGSWDTSGGEALDDGLGVEQAGREAVRVALAALGLRRQQVLAVRERRPEDRGMPVVEHGETSGQRGVHGKVVRLVVGERERVIAGSAREESVITLDARVIPAVPRITEVAATGLDLLELV